MAVIPPLYTRDYFKKILNLEDSAEIRSFSVEPCNAKGDGFQSVLHRITVDYCSQNEQKSVKFVAKSENENPEIMAKIGSCGYDVQATEIRFFAEIAPKIEEILGESEKVVVKAVKVDKAEKVLVLEDLREAGFQMADRTTGLDDAHARLALQKLAKFHAASLKVLERTRNAFDAFDKGFFSQSIDAFNDGYARLFAASADEVATWTGCEVYAEKLRKLESNFIENATKCFDIDPSELNVLNHGDLWTTNVMFKYDCDGNVDDAVMFDFQFLHLGSAALDLNHFLLTSLNDALYNEQDIERLVEFYYNELKTAMKVLKCTSEKMPSLQKFLMEFRRKLPFGLHYTAGIFPLMISEDLDNDFRGLHSDDERARAFRKRVVKTERSARIFRKMLPYFDAMGVLDGR